MNNFINYIAIISLLLFSLLSAQDSSKIANLAKRIKVLEEKLEQSELEKIISEAEEASKEESVQKETKVFKSGQRSLQSINPEISVTGDQFGQVVLNKDHFNGEARSGGYFRVLGIHMQSNLDPFSMAKAVIEFNSEGVELGEAYLTWINVLPNINITAGKFRQQFGIVNRWHEHALDQFDFPLALKTILGEEGLNQIGISVDWLLPSITADANNLTIEVTNGQNDHLFGGDLFSFPAALARLKNYYDLSQNTYLELGITGMMGKNNLRGYIDDKKVLEKDRYTKLGGLDLTVFWEPLNQAKYNSFLWRSELYYADKDMPAGGNITAFGGYSYAEYKLDEHWQVGTRFDYTQPFAQNNNDLYMYQVVPYITWWQSHWVKLRLQYNFLDGKNIENTENTLRLQIVWAVGPHKHDRY